MKFDRKDLSSLFFSRREWFIIKWAEYVRTHPDEEWSRQQAVLIDSVFKRK